MDGSYGNVFGGPPPMSPDTPTASGDQYKVNVSRQKTRKWAEFKPQNYDGDDWGDEYNDGHEATPPPPPSSFKPMGPRQPSAPLSASRQFASGGPPSLQLQTQRAASTPAGPASAGGALERTDLGQLHVVSPQSAMPHSAAATVSSTHSGHTPPVSANPVHAAHPGAPPPRARSPAVPLSAGPVPTRFPPRKSSLGPQDAPVPLSASAPRSRSSSRPGSSRGAPWTEQRPSSPASGRSPITSPTKVQAFTRPADIYRRMEEEKQKERERRSMESTGRPSFDGAVSPTVARSQGLNVVEQNLKPRPEEGADRDTGHVLRPSLPPVAERKSEYGLEGLIASYGTEEHDTEHTAPEQSKPTPSATPTPTPAALPPLALPSQSASKPPSAPATGVSIRRFSSSPKLPELGRMSGFGEDLFAMPSGFSPDSPSVLPPLPDTPAPPVEDSSQVAQPDASTRPAQATPQSNRANQAEVRPPSPQRQQQPPAPTAPSHAVAPVHDKQVSRPPLPGGWVTETLESPAPSPSPAIEAPKSGPSPLMAPPVESSRSEAEEATTKQQQQQQQQQQQRDPTLPRQGSPLAPPPLRTASPAVGTLSPTSQSQPDDGVSDGVNSHPTTPVQAGAIVKDPEITPIAPLNPSRSMQKIDSPAEASSTPPTLPAAVDTSSTLGTTSNSPMKESDVLREEIIKSLSPLNPSKDHLAASAPAAGTGTTNTTAYQAAAGSPLRESAYLGDVYGDYWDSADDKAAPASVASESKTEQKDPAPAQSELENRPLNNAVAEGQAMLRDAESDPKSDDAHRRFSWEMVPEISKAPSPPSQAAEDNSVEHKAASPETSKLTSVAAEGTPNPPASHPSLSIPTVETTEAPPSQGPVGISHQVSVASTVPPGSRMDVPIEPPSPISVQSDGNRPSVEARRLPTAGDKVLVQTLAIPVSPPPLEQHPALVSEPQARAPVATEPVSPTRLEAISIVSFRQIMETPSSVERARLFNETRLQFAAMDAGLNDWMADMVKQHPEHASSSWSFRASLMGPGMAERQQGGPMASQGNVQVPYAQPQANASVVGLGRPAVNMPMPPSPPHGSSAFGHSGAHAQVAQVGTKSKKLLMAAGKAGKGLLSKGRNKLSGGDKVFFNS